jgi:hypothetical protein
MGSLRWGSMQLVAGCSLSDGSHATRGDDRNRVAVGELQALAAPVRVRCRFGSTASCRAMW